MQEVIGGAKRRVRMATAAFALAAFGMLTIGAGAANATGYSYVGSKEGITYYMCKSGAATVKVQGKATSTVSGYSFAVEGHSNSNSYWQSGTSAPLVNGSSSYATVSYRSTDTIIYVRGREWAYLVGGTEEGYMSVALRTIPKC